MAKAASRRVRRIKTEAQLVAEKADAIGLPREQLGQGVYRIRDIKIVDNDRTVTLRTLKNMAGNKVEEWLFIGGPGFDEPQRAAYEHCRALWEKVGRSRLTANYDQEPRHNSNGAGWTQQEAITQLAGYQANLPVHKDDTFSADRAERMDWIAATLADAATQCFQGWVAKTKSYDPTRRVELRYQNFVVVLFMKKGQNGQLKAEFLTCYPVVNRRLPKVLAAPAWNRLDCENAL